MTRAPPQCQDEARRVFTDQVDTVCTLRIWGVVMTPRGLVSSITVNPRRLPPREYINTGITVQSDLTQDSASNSAGDNLHQIAQLENNLVI